MEYYLYMVLCDDGSIYTGTAKDPLRRIGEHATHDPKCAKYTRSRRVTLPLAVWRCESRSDACKYEYAVKRLPHAEKLRLASIPTELGESFCVGVCGSIPCPTVLPSLEECISYLKGDNFLKTY